MADNNNQEEYIPGIQFEDILPWGVTGGDTGLSSRLKLKRNFDKIRARFNAESGLFLSKIDDDTAQGKITFLRGLQVGERFVPGLLGEGGVFRTEEDGTTYIEADKLYIRMKAYFDSVEIREYHHTGGNRIASVAGARCCRVEWIDSNGDVLEKTQANLPSVVKFRCYFMGNDGEDEVRNNWVTGDLAYCHVTTVETDDDSPVAKGLNMKHYWRRVVGRNATGTLTVKGEHWIDLSNVSGQYQSGSDIPEAQDDIVQLGNVSDTTRQGAIIEFVTGADAPSYQIFQGISDFSLTGKNYVRFGYDSSSGGAQAYIGNPDGSTYLWYHRVTEGGVTFPRLDIKANVKFTSPFGDETTIEDFASAVTGDIEDLQAQIDGAIETWFYGYVPTLSNAPANTWTTVADKKNHLGDLFYDTTTGYGYRFANTGTEQSPVFEWIRITDVDVVKALADAAKAQDTADHKRRVFLTTPYPPYDNGDLWVNAVWPASGASQGSTYNDDILRCQTSKAEGGQFSISDWVLASKYTDDSALHNFIGGTYTTDKTNLQQQIDGKAETWYQDNDPSASWNTDEKKASHIGDLWYDTSENGGKKTYIWKDYGVGASVRYAWAETEVPTEVFDQIDGKSAIYTNTFASHPTDYSKNDLWILPADMTVNGVAYKQGEVLTATRDYSGTSTWQADWTKKVRYTDDTALTTFIGGSYAQTVEQLQQQVDKKADTWYQASDPSTSWTDNTTKASHVGDLWYKTTDGTTWYYKDNGASASPRYGWVQQDVPDSVFDQIDGKSSIFVSQPSSYNANDLWILASNTTLNGVDYKQGEVLTSSSDSTAFVASHWTKKVRYTDDSSLTNFLTNTYATDVANLQSQIDGKAETWYQATDPALSWSTQELKAQHVGDLWHNTSSSTVSGIEAGMDGMWNGSQWVSSDVPQEVYDKIDGKSSIFASRPTTYEANDLWIIENNLSSNDMPTGCKAGDIVIADNMPSGTTKRTSYNASDWRKKDRYTDDSKVNQIISKYGQILNIQSPTADDVGEAVAYLDGILKHPEGTDIEGGLVLTSLISLRDTASTPKIWGGISGTYQTSEETTISGYKYLGHGTAAWYGGAMVDYEGLTTAQKNQGWNTHRWARGLDRFDGSGYRANGNLSWDKNGNVTIQGYSINATTLQANGSPVATEGMLANYVTLATAQTITGAKTLSALLTANAGIKTNKLYLYKPNANNDTNAVYIEYESAKAGLHLVGAGFYSDSFVSALGVSSGGGGVTLNEPLNSINNAGLASPTYNGSVLVYSGGAWKYSSAANIFATGLTVAGTASAAGFSATGRDDTYVLLAGGGTKLLSEIGGGGSYLPLSGGEMTGAIGASTASSSYNTARGVNFGDVAHIGAGSSAFGLFATGSIYIRPNSTLNASGQSNGIVLSSSTFTYNGYNVYHAGNLEIQSRGIVVGGGNYNFYSPSNTALNLDSVYGRLAEYDSGGGTSSSSVDINTITTPGVYAGYGSYYYIGDPSVALPSTTYFRLEVSVTRGTGSGTYLRQRLQYYNSYNVRERRSTDGGATWTDFAIVQSDLSNYVTTSALTTTLSGYVTLAGNEEISGAKTFTQDVTVQKSGTSATQVIAKNGNGGISLYRGNNNRGVYDETLSSWLVYTNGTNTLLPVGNVGIGTTSPSYKLHVAGTFCASGDSAIGGTLGVTGAATMSSTLSVANAITLSGNTAAKKRIYFGDTSHYIELDSTGFHFSHGIYSEGFISALGASSGSGGGGVTLNEPLNSINNAGLATPTYNGSVLVYSGGAWKYSSAANIFATGLTVAGTATAAGFSATGRDDTYVLLAGGGTKLLSEIGGGGDENVKVNETVPSSGTWYYPVWYTATSGTGNLKANDGLEYYSAKGTTSSVGLSILRLGNNTASGTDFNSRGTVRIYGTGSYYGQFRDNPDDSNVTNLTANRTYYMPNKTGTLALTSDLSDYLPTIGGAMTGGITMGVNSSTMFNDKGILFGTSGTYGRLSARTNGNVALCAGDGGAVYIVPNSSSTIDTSGRLIVGTSTFTYGGNTIWHAGNDGSESGLDADLLDGLNSNEFPILSRNGTAFASGDTCDVTEYGTYYANSSSIASSLVNTPHAGSNFKLYHIATGNVSYPAQIAMAYNDAVYFRGNSNGTWRDWRRFAFTDSNITGNAASATKLQTARTIWGQSFDGSGNVSGDMTGVGNIYLTSGSWIYSKDSTGNDTQNIRVSPSNNNVSFAYGFREQASGTYIYGGTNGILFRTNGSTTRAIIDSSGNVGIGTTSPSSKLDVSGTFSASGNSTIGGTLDVTGNTTLGGHLYMSNANYIYWKDSGGTDRSVLYVNSSNDIQFGYGYRSQTSSTYIHGGTGGIGLRTNGTTTRMFIDSSGNVSIGSTTASFITEKLNVNGNIKTATGDGTYIQIGGARIVWDNSNSALKVVQSDGLTAANFYATGAVSALGASSSSQTYLDQATADARYLKLSGGQTMTDSFSGTSITLSSQIKSTNAVATAYLTVGSGTLNTGYSLYVNGTAGIKNMTLGSEQQVNTVNCAVIQTLSSRGIYIKSGSAPNYVDGTWANASDIRLKDIVNNAGASVEQVASAPVFNYKWKAGGAQIMLGTSAQYWREVFSFGVSEGPDSYLYMDYASIALASAVMVARKVQSHEERIAALEAENQRLQKEINELKAA